MKYQGFISYGGAHPHHHHQEISTAALYYSKVFQQAHCIQGISFREPLPSTLDGVMSCPQYILAIYGLLPKHRLKNSCLSRTVLSMVFVQQHSSRLDSVHLSGAPRTLGTPISINMSAPLRRLQSVSGRHLITHEAVESSYGMDGWCSQLVDAFRSLLHISSPELTLLHRWKPTRIQSTLTQATTTACTP